MVKFESPIGSKKITGRQMKELEIPDESDYRESEVNTTKAKIREPNIINNSEINNFQRRFQETREDPAEIERSLQAAKDARLGKDRLSDGAKRRIEMLIGMTRAKRSFEIDGNQYELQSLKSREMNDAIRAASAFDGTTSSPFEIRRQLLAYSLVSIAGLDIEQFIGSTNFGDKLSFIDELDHALLNRIYDEYLIMENESREKFSIKSQEEVKEVLEDLKK
jgi:hypothetical protein